MMASSCGFLPLLFKPIFKEKIWGGRALEEKLGKKIPAGKMIGESWELSAVSGDETAARTGPYAGKLLSLVFALEKDRLVGSRHFPVFPLLYKFIDSNADLSLQVHPADRKGSDGAVASGKTECWYVVDAKPDARLICGFKEGVSLQDIRDAVAMERLPQLCNYVPVKPGDVFFVPSGIVHALLDGILIYEMQQTSDATYRLYDWGRPEQAGESRPLHIREALQALDMRPYSQCRITPVSLRGEKGVRHALRVACRYFALEDYWADAAAHIALGPRDSFQVVTVLDGVLEYPGVGGRERIAKGETALVAACQGELCLSTAGPAHFLVSYVPDIASDIVEPLREQAVSDETIAALGGDPGHNDVLPALKAV
jgi:mannose-6-phosphate isomerase